MRATARDRVFGDCAEETGQLATGHGELYQAWVAAFLCQAQQVGRQAAGDFLEREFLDELRETAQPFRTTWPA